jgi:hypothetical protein
VIDPRDYVPIESIVRATVDRPRDNAFDACPVPPWTADAFLHVAECESCQATLDADAVTRGGYDDALAYLPSQALVSRVLSASARPRYRVHLLDDRIIARTTQPAFGKRAAALLGALALSPAVLAAAVVAHIAIVVGLAGVTVFSVSAPQTTGKERVDYVSLGMYHAPLPDDRQGRAEERRRLALRIAHDIPLSSVMSGLPSADVERLDSTVARLRRNREARVLLGADRSPEALSAAEIIGRYLIVRGVAAAQVKIVAGGASVGRVTVSLDTLGSLP